MSRRQGPPARFPSGAMEADDSGSAIEDSLDRASAFRTGPHLYTRPSHPNAHALANTPDAIPSAIASQQVEIPAGSVPEGTPAGTGAQFNVGPPRIQRQAPAARGPTHAMGPPMLGFSAGAGSNIFGGQPVAGGTTTFGSPSEASMSSSFSFAPRAGGSAMFALPTMRGVAPPHALVRPPLPTTATAISAPTEFSVNHIATTPTATNLDTAALAVERRIRETRTRTTEDAPRRPSVSFSPIISTPQHGAYHAGPPPLPPHRAAAGPSRPHRADHLDASMSRLGRATRLPSTQYPDASFSDSSAFTRPTATRLFATPSSNPNRASAAEEASQVFSHTTAAHATQREASRLTSTGASVSRQVSVSLTDESSSTSHSSPEQVRLRKWDGSETLIPAYLVSDSAESAIEELFEHSTMQGFHIPTLLGQHSRKVLGQGVEKDTIDETGQGEDVLLGILEVQLGLKGMHGWYGHSFRNPSRATQMEEPASLSKKRRRTNSPLDQDSFDSNHTSSLEEEPIIVYDTFGRIRGHVTLPNYTRHGGPSFPLPSPKSTFQSRHNAASHLILNNATLVAEKEDSLIREQHSLHQQWTHLTNPKTKDQTIRSHRFYHQLKDKQNTIETFRATQRKKLLKGLQNALLDSTLVGPPQTYRR